MEPDRPGRRGSASTNETTQRSLKAEIRPAELCRRLSSHLRKFKKILQFIFVAGISGTALTVGALVHLDLLGKQRNPRDLIGQWLLTLGSNRKDTRHIASLTKYLATGERDKKVSRSSGGHAAAVGAASFPTEGLKDPELNGDALFPSEPNKTDSIKSRRRPLSAPEPPRSPYLPLLVVVVGQASNLRPLLSPLLSTGIDPL
ncbi:uncharacterized protein CLUP02_12120 [Colletotrichum lupini]|uniref:Uncharacterized protein n=1 Tax=Colletotrichum lupini TaxID=145971 RepID=A0A9Q8WK55_9PEZI|nr:uncharacterized protein CLUP02_12120 [Colletotrichum lupini]UQC86618.1 hypothetical protein CLUP02_12120 [Colletotrichum lupini]